MSQLLALLITTVIIVVLFHLLDWLFWGTSWAHRTVYPAVPKELWRLPMDGDDAARTKAGKRAMGLGALVTTIAAVVFVPMVWLLGPRFAGARVVLLAILLWAVFPLAGAAYNSIYYRIPRPMFWLQAIAGLARIVVGLIAATWLITVFGAW